MKILPLLLILLLPSVALAVRVAALSFDASTNVVSEATTNIPFAVDFKTMGRFDLSAGNVVEYAPYPVWREISRAPGSATRKTEDGT